MMNKEETLLLSKEMKSNKELCDEKRARLFLDEYLRSWICAAEDDLDEAMQKYCGRLAGWTIFHMDNILKKMNLLSDSDEKYLNGRKTWQKEYYRLDLGLYQWDREYHWYLDYAIEHENDHFHLKNPGEVSKSGWLNEFIKLIPRNCLLKVIISYDDFICESKNPAENLDSKIIYLEDLLNDRESRRFLVKTPYLVILGPSLKFMKNNENLNFKAVYFYYQAEKWQSKYIVPNEDAVAKVHKCFHFFKDKNIDF